MYALVLRIFIYVNTHDDPAWLMPLASQYLLLVLHNVQAYIKMLFRVTCQIEHFIVEIFIEDTQYLSLCCARYILLSILCKSLDYKPQSINQS